MSLTPSRASMREHIEILYKVPLLASSFSPSSLHLPLPRTLSLLSLQYRLTPTGGGLISAKLCPPDRRGRRLLWVRAWACIGAAQLQRTLRDGGWHVAWIETVFRGHDRRRFYGASSESIFLFRMWEEYVWQLSGEELDVHFGEGHGREGKEEREATVWLSEARSVPVPRHRHVWYQEKGKLGLLVQKAEHVGRKAEKAVLLAKTLEERLMEGDGYESF